MFDKLVKRIILAAALSGVSLWSNATPITWVLQDVTFASGEVLGAGPFDGTASGFFTFDADTTTYSNVNITTTGAGIWGTGNCGDSVYCGPYIRATTLYTLLTALSLQVTPTLQDPVDATGYYGASLQFVTALTNAGGTVLLNTAGGTDGEGVCKHFDCLPTGSAGVTAFRGFSGGSVSAVPIPATPWLIASALLCLAASKRNRG
jgi:hypothetical protein